jgi:FlaA1/EpsC-like NDP-sugar epimerase
VEKSTSTPLTASAGSANDDYQLPRRVYRVASRLDNASLRLLDGGVITASWLLAYIAGYEGNLPRHGMVGVFVFLAVPVVCQLVANQIAGLYGPVWRYASVEEAMRVVVAVGIGAAASTIATAGIAHLYDVEYPLFTTPPVAALLILLGCGGIRCPGPASSRWSAAGSARTSVVRTLIVGAGNSGVALSSELSKDAQKRPARRRFRGTTCPTARPLGPRRARPR